MDIKNLDLNLGEEKENTPTGTGQPENKSSSLEGDEIQKVLATEIEDVSIADNDLESDEDTVTLSKDKFQKLVEVKDNYKKGLLSLKDKLKAKPKEGADSSSPEEGKYLSRQDFHKANEKVAIDKFVKDNPDMADKANWANLVRYYSGKSGKDTVDGIYRDLDDAKTLFDKYTEKKEEDGKEDKDLKKTLSTETNLSSGGSKGKGKSSTTETGGILKKGTPVKDWYPKEDE